jgi:CheY-like chemotaxis protein
MEKSVWNPALGIGARTGEGGLCPAHPALDDFAPPTGPFLRPRRYTGMEHAPVSSARTGERAKTPAMAARKRILIVEDEMVVAMLVEDMVLELGYEVSGVVSRVGDALALADSGRFDLAILDVHLSGKLIFPFADALADRGIPFMFATGYGEHGIPPEHLSQMVLQKPFRPADLRRALSRLAQA